MVSGGESLPSAECSEVSAEVSLQVFFCSQVSVLALSTVVNMAHSYTPGLTVTEHTTVRRRRMLSLPGSVLVATGEIVRANQAVARAELPGKVYPLNLANQLGVAPDEIHEYLVKKAGDPVRKDEILAENKPLIKWLKTEVLSPVTGVVESVSTVTGQVLLREPPRVLELLGYVDGRIVEVIPQQGVVVETDCSLVQGIFGIGGETRGEIVIAVTSPDEALTPRHLTVDMKGKVVVGGSFVSSDALVRAKEVGVAGLVIGGIHDKDLRALLGYDLGVAITGTEQVGFTLILTEGFGSIPMAGKTFALLSAHAGQPASISGATQIRAGVIRPEIIIPKQADAAGAQVAATVPQREGIRIGDQVRIIRDPLFGKIGEVASLPSDLQKIPTESEVRVMEVRFADGSKAVIPRTNIELIEGVVSVKRERLNVKRDSAGLVCVGILLLAATLCLSFSPAFAQTTLAPPQGLRVFDTPSDGGGSLTVLWSPASYDSAAAKYQVLLSEGTTVPDLAAMKVVAEFPANQRYVRESKWPWWTRPTTGEQHQFTLRNGKGVELKNGNAYSITVAAVLNDDRVIATPVQATPQPNWLNWNQMNNLILALLFGGIVFYAIGTARKREIFLRRIPGLDAVDEAIGRATELGKPILYMTGAHDMSDPSTIAAAVILGRVAKRAAAYETDLLVPHREPITMAVCQEITKQAYLEAGKPDLYQG